MYVTIAVGGSGLWVSLSMERLGVGVLIVQTLKILRQLLKIYQNGSQIIGIKERTLGMRSSSGV